MENDIQQIAECTSDAQYFNFQLKWKIHRDIFRKLGIGNQDFVEKSGTFDIDFLNSKWAIQVFSNGHLHIKLILENADQELGFKSYYYFAKENVENLSFRGLGSEVKGKVNCSSSVICNLQDILGNNEYLQNNYFTLICKVEAYVVVFHETKRDPSYISSMTHSLVSSSDKNLKLLQTGLHSDIILVVGGEKFKVHKNILAIDCDYFHSMFEKNFKEGKESEITIQDVDPKIFEKILSFIYAGQIPENLPEIADKLLLEADRFGLEYLALECEKSLTKTISINSCIELYKLADSCSRKHLGQDCIRFIKRNCAAVMEREDWKELATENPRLALQIVEDAFKNQTIQDNKA